LTIATRTRPPRRLRPPRRGFDRRADYVLHGSNSTVAPTTSATAWPRPSRRLCLPQHDHVRGVDYVSHGAATSTTTAVSTMFAMARSRPPCRLRPRWRPRPPRRGHIRRVDSVRHGAVTSVAPATPAITRPCPWRRLRPPWHDPVRCVSTDHRIDSSG
jgi:hypothetical protein